MTGPIVVAVGGNALAPPGAPFDVAAEAAGAAAAMAAIAPLAAAGGLVVTHGNGPQVGALVSDAEAAGRAVPLSVHVAESQGHVGHLLALALGAALPDVEVVALLTHVLVDPDDPALTHPSKPIGTAPRRLVASPEPTVVLELAAVRRLLGGGAVVIAGGGGGVPLRRGADGRLDAVEGVVDKDHTSALLAIELDARALVLLTDVDGLHLGWGTAADRLVADVAVDDLRDHAFEAGTMGPKVEAACAYVAATGRVAHIGALGEAAAVAAGRAGTTIRPG